MSVSVLYGIDYSAIEAILNEAVSSKPSVAGSKRDIEIYKASHTGKLSGLQVALAALANEIRAKAVQKLGLPEESGGRPVLFPALLEHDFISFVREARELWQKLEETKPTSAERDKFIDDLVAQFYAMVENEEFSDYYKRVRRDAILKGHLRPSSKDREWIEEEREAYAALARPYDSLLDQLKESSSA